MNENREILIRALNLTLAVYRLTERFPDREFLRWQLRQVSNEIIGDLTFGKIENVNKKIELLLIYFEIGRVQNWVREINWLILENEYRRLAQKIGDIAKGEQRAQELTKDYDKKNRSTDLVSHNIQAQQKKEIELSKNSNLSDRQEKIYYEIKNRGSLKMSDFIPLFKNQASERTIRNDLQILLGQGLISKTGSHRSTKYYLK
jgi:hypothetical protein